MKGYLVDQFGELSLYDIPALLISMIAAAAMVFVLGFALTSSGRKEALKTGMVLAALLCFGATLGRNSLPIAVLIAGTFIMAFPLLKIHTGDRELNLFTVVAMVIGVACGVKGTVIAGIALVPLFLLLFLNARKNA